ncbi:MAG: pyridoxal phosphate-dependent aminotransferase family protein, partial [Ignavibacteriaceae bacterium]|nr:pyridoxal phosphate-dependent aminotransferase family protein [Ignavibacteriaceae bacterium]
MERTLGYSGGENFDLHSILLRGQKMNINEKTEFFGQFINDLSSNDQMLCMRCISSAADREVQVYDELSQSYHKMLMFGSNNYLGLANHPYIIQKVKEAVDEYGIGVSGPPLLNGYTKLHRELEEKLAEFKNAEDAMIFSSGYGANVGLVSGLMNRSSIVLYDAYSHASFCDGIKLSGAQSYCFPHNDLKSLEARLKLIRSKSSDDVFVGVEGVYSMDGDTAPLDELLVLCKRYDAILIVDDAHGTGVMGEDGKGTAEAYNVEGSVDITMGTFSKTFAVTGGFIVSSKEIINYLRFFARSYMFSASVSPAVAAAVLAGLEVIKNEPERLQNLCDNIQYANQLLNKLGFTASNKSAIIPLRVPLTMNIRKAAYEFHKRGVF